MSVHLLRDGDNALLKVVAWKDEILHAHAVEDILMDIIDHYTSYTHA